MKKIGALLVSGCTSVYGIDPVVQAPPADAALSCPQSYLPSGDGFYRVIATGDGHFDNANMACLTDESVTYTGRMHAVVISSASDHAAIKALVTGTRMWIGMTDRQSTTGFRWVTDEQAPTDGYWQTGEPDNIGNEHCVVILADGTLDSLLCDTGSPYPGIICECDRYPYVSGR